MRNYLFVAAVILPFLASGEEKDTLKDFEITKKNCNLPMKKIRQLLPDSSDQHDAMQRCMAKAVKERWKRQKNLLIEQ